MNTNLEYCVAFHTITTKQRKKKQKKIKNHPQRTNSKYGIRVTPGLEHVSEYKSRILCGISYNYNKAKEKKKNRRRLKIILNARIQNTV